MTFVKFGLDGLHARGNNLWGDKHAKSSSDYVAHTIVEGTKAILTIYVCLNLSTRVLLAFCSHQNAAAMAYDRDKFEGTIRQPACIAFACH